MKKCVLALCLIFVMLFSVHIPTNADEQLMGQYGFMSSEIEVGTIQGVIKLASASEDVVVVLACYTKDHIMTTCESTIISDTNMHFVSIEIDSLPAFGSYIKMIVFGKDSLQPVTPQTNLTTTLYCTKGEATDANVTYDSLAERYYTLTSVDGDGALTVSGRNVTLSDTPTKLRLKDMTDGECAFEDSTQSRYRLEFTEENGVRMYYYSVGGDKQRWELELSGTRQYAIKHTSGKYLAVVNGAVTLSDEKYQWKMEFASETPTTLVTALDGFKLLTEAEQQRVIDICTSIGADALPSAATNGKSFLDNIESEFLSIYLNQNSLTAEEEKTKILSAVSAPVMGSLVDYYTVSEFPGGDATITQKDPVKTTHVMWDLVEENGVIYSASEEHPYTGAPINCYRIDVTYTTEDTTQNVAVYCVDPSFANVQTAINALGKFPYAYRQHIKTMYVYLSTTTATYNCGGEELFVRLTGTASEQAMIKGFAHELGHSNDYMANGDVNNRASHWSQGAKWTQAVTDDIATISTYGNSNSDEGFAEFARLYWLCYGNRDLEIGIKQLYPNRFESFQRMLTKIGCSGETLY